MRRLAILGCLLHVLIATQSARSDTYNWTGDNNHIWSDPRSWHHLGTILDNPPFLEDFMIPDGTAEVFISNGDVVSMDVNTAFIDHLTISNGSDLLTNGRVLTVNDGAATGELKVVGFGARLRVDGSTNPLELDTDILRVFDGAILEMNNGAAQVDNFMVVDDDSTLLGRGSIQFNDNLNTNGRHLVLDGTLTVASGNLTLIADQGGTLDMDGDFGNSVINVTSLSNRLTFDAALSDTFGGTLNVGAGNMFDARQGWRSNGTLNLTGGTIAGGTYEQIGGATNINSGTNTFTAPVNLSTGSFNVAGGATVRFEGGGTLNSMTIDGTGTAVVDSMLNVTGGTSRINPTARFDSGGGANIVAGSTLILDRSPRFNPGSLMDVDGTLRLFAPTTYAGGSFTGNGTVSQQASVIVTGNTTMNLSPTTGVYDWDGAGSQNEMTTVNSGRTFRINANRLNPSTGASKNHYTGRLNVNGGRVEVNTADPWQVVSGTSSGEVHFNSFAGPATLAGQDVSVSGAGTEFDVIFGQATIESNISFDNLADVRILNGGSGFTFEGDVDYNGTTIRQDFAGGLVRHNGDIHVTGAATINATTFDWDGTNPAAQTTLISPGGSLTINADTIDTTAAASDGNDDNVFVQAGILTVNTVDPWRMDGLLTLSTGAGQAQVNGSPLRMVSSGSGLTVTGGNAGSINVPLTLDGNAGVSVNGSSRLHFNGPTTIDNANIVGAGSLVFDNLATIESPADIVIGTFQLSNDADVTMDGGTVLATNFLKDSAARFDLNGGSFEVRGGTATFNSSFTYSGGNSTSNQPVFTVSNGADAAITAAWRVGENAGEFGRTVVTGVSGGSPSTLRGTSGGAGADLVVGRSGTGRLEVLDGGRTEVKDDLVIANNTGSAGSVLVSGVNGGHRSTIDQTGRGNESRVEVGRLGDGQLTVSNGALVDVGGLMTVGSATSGAGIVDIVGSAGGFNAEVRVGDDLIVRPSGQVHVRSGGKLDVAETISLDPGAIVTVSGTGNLDPHLLTIDAATFDVEPTATVVISDAGATTDPGFFVGLDGGDGQVVVMNGGSLSTGAVTVGGPRETGSIEIDATSEWEIDGDLTIDAGGSVQSDGSLSPTNLIVEPGGTLSGSGMVDARFVNDGLLSPGDSPGILTVNGDFTQTAQGTLRIELGGHDPVSEYDVLDVLGTAELDGTLDIALIDLGLGTFMPELGDAFSIVSAARGLTGTFADVVEPALPEGLVWDLLYESDEVLLSVVEATAGLPADFDGDGDVDGEDFLAWQSGFGITSGATKMDGDTDGDGDVDGEDFLEWQSTFGDAAGAGGRSVANVPEPSAALLMVAIGIVAVVTRRRGQAGTR